MADGGNGTPLKVAIIGSGFGGLGMAYSLKQSGIEHFAIFEKARDLGGTWRENTYPGCGCDVPSHFYSFSFEPHYPWAWRYAKQSEIHAYQHHVAKKYDLERHIRYGMQAIEMAFDEARALWTLRFANGETVQAQTVVSAVGQLHQPAYPNIAGRERFAGKSFHSSAWDHDFDLNGKRVAVIGTGASAVQFVPEIAPKVGRLHLFQRSPGWTFPKVEKQFSRFERWLLDTFPLIHDLDRLRIFIICELLAAAYNGNRLLAYLVTSISKLQAWWQVRDPVLRKKLRPDFPIGCKRILLSNAWLPALTRPNVEVVDDAIVEIVETGVRTADGRLREVDAIIYGTGFKATQFLTPMRVRGLGGKDLHQTWAKGAEAYYGMAVSGFPNFYMLYGPNTNVGSGSIIYMLERQQRYIARLIEAREAHGWDYLDLRAEAQAAYAAEMQRRSAGTTYSGNCQSWYKTADGRNTNNWVGSMMEFSRRLKQPVLEHYRGVARRLPAEKVA
ncbi:flavin-containing monooxygenase [Sinimarinibacterium thermocellulolyticum]|uniref:NAD(P)/FAD-dependent oxidoreductase n=1 Tax=Sinimarinibacterium thermocellulolyticum TaxID=3170016 RepID=A0ABV2ACM1_9GAMM